MCFVAPTHSSRGPWIDCLFLAAAAALIQFDFGSAVQEACVAFIGVDVDFQFRCFVGSDQNVVKDGRAVVTDDLQLHHVAVRHAVMFRVGEIHVRVSGGTDDALFQLNAADRADQNTSGCSINLSAVPDRGIDPQRDRIGECQFHLAGSTCRSQNANARQHASTRADDHHRLFGRVKAVLIEIFVGFEHRTGTEQNLDVFVRQVDVTRRYTDAQVRFAVDPTRRIVCRSDVPGGRRRERVSEPAIGDGAANQRFDSRAVDRSRVHSGKSLGKEMMVGI